MTTTETPEPLRRQAAEAEAWGVLVQAPDMSRGEWLTPDGHLTSRRVHAGLVYGEEGRRIAERQAASIEAYNPGTKARAREF